ncbi:MAG: hypothetical protein SCK70_03195, partial [bacterium]|nr:hypothetical protein [bacterium]
MRHKINLRQLLIVGISLGMLFFSFSRAMDSSEENYRSSSSQKDGRNIYALSYTLEAGDILYSFPTEKDGTVGVTIVGDKVIVSVGGDSADAGDNKFYVYNFNGTLAGSFLQGSTTGMGFRDLAFDGVYILASEDNTIKKIDPNTFQIVASITNTRNSIHRGLAFDAVDNVIWSADGSAGPLMQIDPATGGTLFPLPNPVSYAKPYGLAFDRFTGAQDPYLWFAEPWSYGQFRLSKVNIWDGLIYHTIDLTAALARSDSCLSGGLEIIDNHPDYPGKIIAVAVEQKTNSILFIDITGTPLPDRILLWNRASIGGWLHCALVENNFLYEFRANDLNILDLADDKRKLSSTLLPAEPQNGTIFNDYLYFYYPWQNENFKKKIEFINITNKNRPFISGSYQTSRILTRGIMKLSFSSVAGGNNFLFVLTQESTNWGALEKILLLELPSPTSPVYKSQLSADIADIAAAGNYVYVLLKTPQQKFTIYDISSNTFIERGSIPIPNPEKVAISGDYAYVACTNAQGLRVIDISNPQAPFEATAFGNGVYSFYDDIVLVNNPTAFLKTIDFDIVSVDISNPRTPVEVSHFNPDGVGNFKFSGYYDNSLFLTDAGTLYEVDYTIPSTPSVALGTFEPSIIRSNTGFGNKLYSVGNNKLWEHDVNENGVPVFSSSIDIAKADKVFTDGDYLFISDRDNLLYLYDMALQPVGSFDAGTPVMDAVARNNTLYVVLYNSTDLKVVDYSNPASPSETTRFALPYSGTALSLSGDSNTLFVASNKDYGSANEQGYFQAIDVSNPANPVLLSDQQIAAGHKIKNLRAAGNL